MWAVTRDGKIYLIRPSQINARRERDILSSGDTGKWAVKKVMVTVRHPNEK